MKELKQKIIEQNPFDGSTHWSGRRIVSDITSDGYCSYGLAVINGKEERVKRVNGNRNWYVQHDLGQ